MFDLNTYLAGFGVLLVLAVLTWIVSVLRHNVAIVDGMWSLFFLAAALTYAAYAAVEAGAAGASGAAGAGVLANLQSLWQQQPRVLLLLLLVTAWALRLSIYITARNWGHGEDRRYVAIRKRNEPGFTFKSLYLVFVLQALLAWIISLPLLGAVLSTRPLGWLDVAGVAAWSLGFFFESVGDWQLSRFRRDPANSGAVMDRGLWRYTRHPNYFGDFCVWWGFYLIALSAGAWWSIPGPLLMSTLLMRVSGVTLLEKTIGKRRAGYDEYIRRTNAFFPGPRK